MANLGLIQVYTGNGKGKTTASLGIALRACGHGYKVAMIQFMKKDEDYGEYKTIHSMRGFEIYQVGRNDFVDLEKPALIDVELAQAGWVLAQSTIKSMKYDIVILDELNVAIACKMIDVKHVVSFFNNDFKNLAKPPEIIITGRYAPEEIISIANLVTEMKEVKHYYQAGVASRRGVDY